MRIFIALLVVSLAAGCATPPPAHPPQEPTPKPAPKVALALGGGAARGFAHIGVIKALEAQGIRPEIVTGTSAGSVIGALYAGGLSGFQIQKLALEVEESTFTDWSLPDRGLIRGEALQDFINKTVQNRPLEKLARPFGVVATDLASGQKVVFRTGNTGMAVRASSAVPGVFKPLAINGKEYVDGGLTSPIPVQAAKAMGADIVIAVDIGDKPEWGKTGSTLEVLLQTFTIMGNAISRHEMREADIVIRPDTARVNATDFEGRHLAILEGEKATAAVMPALKKRLAEASAR
jgi:NTE family protein